MLRIFYEEETGNVMGVNSIESQEEPIDSLYKYIDIEKFPYVKPFRQGYKVENGQLVVFDFELNEQQEKEATKMECLTEIGEKQQYLRDTDYVANKLSEIIARYILSNDNTELLAFNEKYKDILTNRETYRQRVSYLNELIEKS